VNINDLHDIRDGKSIKRRKRYNPFIHVAQDTPLMQMLFSITRPVEIVPVKMKPVVRAIKKVVPGTTTKPGSSMVSYTKERKKI
jgi:ribose 5-phosphate isomerase